MKEGNCFCTMLYPVALKIFNRRYIVTKSKVISGKLYLKLSYILRHHSIFELAKLQYFSLFESIKFIKRNTGLYKANLTYISSVIRDLLKNKILRLLFNED